MIKLKVEKYCQDCPEFKPCIVRDIYGYINQELTSQDMTVMCEHRLKCAAICQHIRKCENEQL